MQISINSVNFRVVIEFLSACTNLLIMSVIVCNFYLSEELIIKNATKNTGIKYIYFQEIKTKENSVLQDAHC